MKICSNCGTQNEDSFSKCVACGGDLPITGDEATTMLDPMDANAQAAGNMQGAAYGMQNDMGAMPYNSQPMGEWNQPQPQPAKSSKKGIFIALGAIVVVVAVALVLIFKFGFGAKGGAGSPEDVAKIFIEAMDERDVDKMVTLCPPFADPGRDSIKASMDQLDMYDSSFKYVGITEKTKGDIDDIEADIKEYYDKTVSVQEVYELEIEYEMTMSYLGESYTDKTTDYMTVIKYKNKWYLYE